MRVTNNPSTRNDRRGGDSAAVQPATIGIATGASKGTGAAATAGAASTGDASDRRGRRAAQRAASERQQTRVSLYDSVTARIVAELEAGRFPWVQPWGRAPDGATVGLPRNALSGRPYSGINVLLLWGAAIDQGFASQAWLTFRQAQGAGGAVRKGEQGTTVVYADRFVPKGATPGSASGADGDEDRDARGVPFLKRFTVFNVAQVEGLPDDLFPDPVPLPPREIVPVGEQLIAASGVAFRIGGDRAYYAPGEDVVQVPPQPAFFDQINYYRTALHELTHATGHASRLDRQRVKALGGKDYAREELVAELGSAFVCAALGIVPTVRHADYLGSWLAVLREDNRAIFRAASAASKAADWLLARHDAARAAAGAAA